MLGPHPCPSPNTRGWEKAGGLSRAGVSEHFGNVCVDSTLRFAQCGSAEIILSINIGSFIKQHAHYV